MIVSAQIVGDEERIDGPPDALLPWWSFGKTVLAAAAFKLAEQGKLQLDTPLAGRSFTLRQLLGHRAGVPNYGPLADYHAAVARGDNAWPVEKMLARAKADTLLFSPGTGWSYSNIGYVYVRHLIEHATDSDLRSALHATIFAPLGLHAFMTRRREDVQRVLWRNLNGYDPNWVYHGLIVGTAPDAARFLHRLFTSQFLSNDSRTALFDSVPLPFALPDRPFRKPTCGTGLMIDPQSPHGMMFGHTGGGPGSVSAVFRFPDLEQPRTVAAFADHDDEAALERHLLELAGT